MRAMQIIEWGQPLQFRDYPTPEPTGEQVLVCVESAGVWDGREDADTAIRTTGLWLLSSDPRSVAIRQAT
jgi:NADPH:quinone reductase-like Zn-dependent oxidoreductase